MCEIKSVALEDFYATLLWSWRQMGSKAEAWTRATLCTVSFGEFTMWFRAKVVEVWSTGREGVVLFLERPMADGFVVVHPFVGPGREAHAALPWILADLCALVRPELHLEAQAGHGVRKLASELGFCACGKRPHRGLLDPLEIDPKDIVYDDIWRID